MTLKLEEYSGDGRDWDAFVLAHPEARFSQLFGYGRVVEESYGFKPRYEGQRHGKAKWGCRFQDYHCYTIAAAGRPPKSFSSSSGYAEGLSRIWRDWVPMALATRIGPYLRRQLGK